MDLMQTLRSTNPSLSDVKAFNEDGSNDPAQPTQLQTVLNTTSLWLQGTVSAADPDYFYIPIPAGMTLAVLRLESYQSSDAVAFVALQSGTTFSAGTDTKNMLLAQHIGAADLDKNLLSAVPQPIEDDVVLWVNQTGTASEYLLSLDFEILAGPYIFMGEEGNDALRGTVSRDFLAGLAGNDTMTGGLSDDTIDGGVGTDTAVYGGPRENFLITTASIERGSICTMSIPPFCSPLTFPAIRVSYVGPIIAIFPQPATEGADLLVDVERIQFTDTTIALDTDRIAGQAYRIYTAAFDRTPDTSGLGYWIAQMDKGMDVVEVAARFIDSAEFRQLYGSTVSDATFITNVYNNVLDRNPDDVGLAWWVNEMKTNPSKTWQKVLADFSESAENKANVASLIANGIAYDPWE
jgi:hypothetical protein